jgi:hypothetical protein
VDDLATRRESLLPSRVAADASGVHGGAWTLGGRRGSASSPYQNCWFCAASLRCSVGSSRARIFGRPIVPSSPR